MTKILDASFKQAFDGKVLAVERSFDVRRGGYIVRLEILVPFEAAADELDIYRRIGKLVNLLTEKEESNNVR